MRRSEKPRPLRTFVLATIGIAAISCIALIICVFLINMLRMQREAERYHLSEMTYSVRGAAMAELRNLSFGARDLSSWDNAYLFARGDNPDFIRENLDDGTFLGTRQADYILIRDAAGRDLYLGARESEDGGRLPVPEGLIARFASICGEVLQKNDAASGDFSEEEPNFEAGFLAPNGQSYMFCTMPILKTDEGGPAAGTLTFIKIFGDVQMRALTHMDTTQFTIREGDPSSPLSLDLFELKGMDTVDLETSLEGLGGGRQAILSISHPRVLYANGRPLIMATAAALFASLLAVMVFLFLIAERRILRPLEQLIADVRKAEQDEVIDTEKYCQSEEMYALSNAINDMRVRVSQSNLSAQQTKTHLHILENILNGLDAYLYASDPTTDEILFINSPMKEHFGIDGDAIGKVCWTLLQSGFSEKCQFCPCYKLEENPDEPIVWEEHNTRTGRFYRNTDTLIDWIGGRKVHLQHSVDISDIKTAQHALQKRLAQQALMTSITRNFIKGKDISAHITQALKMTGEFMGIARILLIHCNEKARHYSCKGEWLNPACDIPSQLKKTAPFGETNRQAVLEDLASGAIEYADSGKIDLGPHSEAFFADTEHFLLIPVFMNGDLWGVLDFGKNEEGSEWTQSDVDLAKLVASTLSGVIDRHYLDAQLRHLSSIVESSPQFISYLKADGTIDYVNPAAMKITGYSREELLAGGLELIYSAEDSRRIREAYLPQIITEGQLDFELEMHCKDGGKRIMIFSAFTTGREGGRFGGIASDITEMRKMDKELIAAKELAEEGSRAKSEFLARMSHEIRTPMNAIIGMTRIAQTTDDIRKKNYGLEKIAGASGHLLGVINDILDMSKIEANKFELSQSEFSFDRMLMNVINVVSSRMNEKMQNLSIDVDPTMPRTLIGDEQRLAQVCANLLTNAAKFTPERGKIRLVVRSSEDDGDNVDLQIEISDNGIGITKEQQAKLFQSFEQADGSIVRKFGGTGLGLAISKRIVELMGGTILVESEAGVGSRFTVSVKIQKGTRPALEIIGKKHGAGKPYILAVDDNAETRDYFLHVMAALGISCLVAANGKDALRIVSESEKPFDMIFVDWKMPIMDGIELTRELKKQKNHRFVIIMISAAEWTEMEQEARDAGVDGFLPKPLFPSLIMDCINKYMSESMLHEITDEPPASKRRFPGRALLLVEDIEINREIIITILEDTEMIIDSAVNGREAVEMFTANQSRYDIVFMDVHMSEMDGLEATRRIRALGTPESARIPIVAMTANVFKEDIEKCLDSGMNDHIGKPVDFDEMFEKLAKYLG